MRIALSTAQWMMFILAGSVVAPLAIGQAYGMTPIEVAEFVQRTFFVLGLVSLLQVLFGHQLPIMEGPAVLWWGVFLLFANLATAMHQDVRDILPLLEMGLLLSGLVFLVLSVSGLINTIRKLFTPLVIGTYFILLVVQMSSPFLNGILGIKASTIDWRVAVISLATLLLSIILAISRHMVLRSYSVLIAIAFGWSVFIVCGLYQPFALQTDDWITLPQYFAWGLPKWDGGTIVTSGIVTLLLLSNVIASIDAVEKVVQPPEPSNQNRSGFIMGTSQILSGIFSTVGLVPLSYTAGFILTTKLKERLPFLLGSLVLLVISFFPTVTMLFASIPVSVGYASVFLSFANMIGMGLREISVNGLGERQCLIVGISLMLGTGCMFIPTSFLLQLPTFISPLISNGLLVGVVTCILLEQGFRLSDHSG